MVEFVFDAAGVEPSLPMFGPWQKPYETPFEYASALWEGMRNNDKTLPFDIRCELAEYDRVVFDQLQTDALDTNLTEIPETARAQLAVALIRKPPSGRTGAIQRRDDRLRAIGVAVHTYFGLPFAQPTAGGNVPCVAAILAALPDTPSEGTIATDILSGCKKRYLGLNTKTNQVP
jgi:hypothetical protein